MGEILRTHRKVATLPDQGGKEVNAPEWNDNHKIEDGIANALVFLGGDGESEFVDSGLTYDAAVGNGALAIGTVEAGGEADYALFSLHGTAGAKVFLGSTGSPENSGFEEDPDGSEFQFYTNNDTFSFGSFAGRAGRTNLLTPMGSFPVIVAPNVNTTAVGNVGGGEDALITYDLPGDVLGMATKGVRTTQWGTFANTAETKTIKSYFGTQVVLTNALTINLAGTWKLVVEVFSTGTDAQDYVATLTTTGAAGVALNDVEVGTATQDDGAAITIKCTADVGAPSTNNGIVQEGQLVEYFN